VISLQSQDKKHSNSVSPNRKRNKKSVKTTGNREYEIEDEDLRGLF